MIYVGVEYVLFYILDYAGLAVLDKEEVQRVVIADVTTIPSETGELTKLDATASKVQEVKQASDIVDAEYTEGPPLHAVADTRSRRARAWTPLESITVRNFKATLEAIIPLGQVTILVGPNGSGKS